MAGYQLSLIFLINVNTYNYDNFDRPNTLAKTNGSGYTTIYLWSDTNKPANAAYGIKNTANDGSVSITWCDRLGRSIRSEKNGFGGTMILTDTESIPKVKFIEHQFLILQVK